MRQFPLRVPSCLPAGNQFGLDVARRQAASEAFLPRLLQPSRPWAKRGTVSPMCTDLEDRRKHLEMVQAVVSRMAAASSTAKGWLLPVVTATYGYALVQHTAGVAALGLAAVAIFAVLDAQYLRQERAYRVLFRAVAENRVSGYDLNARRYFHKPNGDDEDERHENCQWRHIIWSWSLAGFHGPLAVTGAVVFAAAVTTRYR